MTLDWINRLDMDPASLAVIGLGNPDRADDGIGLAVADALAVDFPHRVFSESQRPADGLVMAMIGRPDIAHVLFIDAADFKGEPGGVRLFDPDEIHAFRGALSTHQTPMTVLIQLLEAHGKRPWILGVQPASLALERGFSPLIGHIKDPLIEGVRRLLKGDRGSV